MMRESSNESLLRQRSTDSDSSSLNGKIPSISSSVSSSLLKSGSTNSNPIDSDHNHLLIDDSDSRILDRENSYLPSRKNNGDSESMLPLHAASDDAEEDHPMLPEDEPAPTTGSEGAKMWKELTIIFRITMPLFGAYVSQNLITLVNVLFVGHIGEDELAAAALATMFINVTGYSLGIGILGAMDTLASQAFGAGNFMRVGVILQRGIVICAVLILPVSILWLYCEDILIGFGQDETTSRLAGTYTKWCIPSLIPVFLFEAIKRYLQAQSVVKPELIVSIATFFANIFFSFVFVIWAGLGYIGAPIALTLSDFVMLFILLGWIKYKSLHKKTWPGWSWDAFRGWKEFLALGIPGTIQLCAEWWGFEIHALLAGYFGTISLAAQTLIMNTIALAYTFPLGVSVAASVRVGNLLGANKPKDCIRSARAAMLLTLIGVWLEVIILMPLHDYWGYIFSDNDDVAERVGSVLPILCAFMTFDGLQGCIGGVMRGSGRQTLAAVIMCSGYWGIGLPGGWFLAKNAELDIEGQWVALSIASFLVAVVEFFFLARMDWQKYALEAVAREHEAQSEGILNRHDDASTELTSYKNINDSDSQPHTADGIDLSSVSGGSPPILSEEPKLSTTANGDGPSHDEPSATVALLSDADP